MDKIKLKEDEIEFLKELYFGVGKTKHIKNKSGECITIRYNMYRIVKKINLQPYFEESQRLVGQLLDKKLIQLVDVAGGLLLTEEGIIIAKELFKKAKDYGYIKRYNRKSQDIKAWIH